MPRDLRVHACAIAIAERSEERPRSFAIARRGESDHASRVSSRCVVTAGSQKISAVISPARRDVKRDQRSADARDCDRFAIKLTDLTTASTTTRSRVRALRVTKKKRHKK